jgi:hypothetical protein
MPHSTRILARALLLAALLLMALGATAIAGGDEPPTPIVQTSLTVQPDLCQGYAIVWMSYDEGETWHPFVQSAVHGDPTNCKPINYAEPYFTQSSLEWTPELSHGHGPYPAEPAAGVAGPWGESQQVTLSEVYRASTGALVTTVPVGRHEAESYYAQVTVPSRHAQLDFSFGAKAGTYQRRP